jgi:biopolymer transport protein ExbD
MAMSVGNDGDDTVMSEINTTPLVDVMLVLLIIFLITIPVVIQTVPLALPSVRNIPTETKPENVSLSVNRNCEVFWGQVKLDSNAALREKGGGYLKSEIDRMRAAGLPVKFPEVHIRGDSDAEYRCVGGAIFAMQRAGYQKIAFISEPPPGFVSR